MFRTTKIRLATAAAATLALSGIALLAAAPTLARVPFTAAELADQQKQLLAVVDHGRDLWHGGLQSSNGLACGNCHPDAAATNPQTFPKFQDDMARVVPLRDMINWCITAPLAGKAIDPDGADMVALEAYALYLHRGVKIDPGLATRQTTPIIAITSGTGYPRKPSGIGYDK